MLIVKFWRRIANFLDHHFQVYLLVLAALMNAPFLRSFFWSDDWYFLALTKQATFREVILAFAPWYNPMSTPMYRPISSQLFYALGQALFGWQAHWWYGWQIASFVLAGLLFWKITYLLFNRLTAHFALFLFLFNSSWFTRISYLASWQETVMLFFLLLSLWFWLHLKSHKQIFMVVFFWVLALMSQETAVIFPGLLAVIWLGWPKLHYSKQLLLWPFLVIFSLAFVAWRFLIYGSQQIGMADYVWNFSPLTAIHTGAWYGIWTVGAPEMLIDYVSNGQIIPRFWSDFGFIGQAMIAGLSTVVILMIIAIILKKVYLQKRAWLLLGWILISLLPVLFFPGHKFVIRQSLALVAFCWLILLMLNKVSWRWQKVFLVGYLLLNSFSWQMYQQSFYGVIRPQISKRFFDYVQANDFSHVKQVVLINDQNAPVETWGVSKQVAQAIGFSNFWLTLFPEQEIEFLYQDQPDFDYKVDSAAKFVPSSQFLP